jgi:predicted HTH domain antitoxin
VTVDLPANLEGTLSESALRLRLAFGLFVSEDLTLAQAAEYAGISRDEFLKEMERHDINLHYGVQELAEDLETLRKDGLL